MHPVAGPFGNNLDAVEARVIRRGKVGTSIEDQGVRRTQAGSATRILNLSTKRRSEER
jgi:hypothetical protein